MRSAGGLPASGAAGGAWRRRLPQLNARQASVVRLLRTQGPLSRSTMAVQLGASNAAMTRLARELQQLGLIEEAPSPGGEGRGRPSVPLRLAARGGYAIGATVHVGVLEVVVVDYAGQTLARSTQPFRDPDPSRFAEALRSTIHALVEQNRLIGWRMLGVGIGIPGASLSADGERWNTAAPLDGWRGVSLRPLFEQALGLPVWMENDANAAAMADFYLGGAIDDTGTTILILLGHGIGAGIVARGRLFRGEAGNAGDIGGLFPLDRPRPSTLDFLATLRAAGCSVGSVEEVPAFLEEYRPVVTGWIARAARQLEQVVTTGYLWFNPRAITLCSALPHSVLEGLAGLLGAAPTPPALHREQPPEIRISALGGLAPAIGAALLPIHALETG